MRVWDISPGYLNRGSLLGEHRELHGLHAILSKGTRGYAQHPETRRWAGCETGLVRRHAELVAEMQLRGYVDLTPIATRGRRIRWPASFVTPPSGQFALLATKYRGVQPGRIPLPRTPHELWAQHKYSVMARDQDAYRSIGRRVARLRRGADASALAEELVALLRTAPSRGAMRNALEHMWGYVSTQATAEERELARASLEGLLLVTRALAIAEQEPYLIASTALSDLAVHALG